MQEEQREGEAQRHPSTPVAWFLLLPIMLPLLYFLTSAPMLKFCFPKTLDFYEPLFRCAESFPPFGACFHWYLSLWGCHIVIN